MSWYNPLSWGKDLAKRDYGISNIPEKVFVEYENNQIPGGGNSWEYSEIEPARFGYDLDSLFGGAYGKQNFITLFYCLPEIFAPINEIATRVADANWQLCKDWNDEVDYNNPTFNRLFSKPNPLMSFKQFVWQAVCYEYLTGANFEYFNKPSFMPDEAASVLTWWNLASQKVSIDKKKNIDIYSATDLKDFINGYKISEDGKDKPLETQKVLPLIHFDLLHGNDIDKYRSPLTGAQLAIKNLIPVYEARGVIYLKRGALGFLVSKKSDASGLVSLTPGEKDEAQKIYQQTYGLTRGKNQVGVSAAPVEYVSTSMSIQELQPFEETDADASAIYAVLKVPPHLKPTKDKSTFNNANADMKAFYGNVIQPLAEKYAQAWTSYFKFERRYIKPNFDHIAELQENKKEKSEVDFRNGSTWLQRWQNGTATLNDWIVSFDGNKGTGSIYEKKIFELSPEEVLLVKNIINLKSNGTTSENKGTETQSSTNQL